jgi:MinD-like ATPase involved in chromosome partitioning or flagellar assembly
MAAAPPRAQPVPRPVTRGLVASILADPDQGTLHSVIRKSIAVGSGKGGVGKTITASNLSLHFARKGMRVALVDLDPLSDVASLLDLYESEQALQDQTAPTAAGGVQENIIPVFRGLDILFPYQKLDAANAAGLMEKLYRGMLREIDARYELLIFDMPAGISYEDNLAYLAFMSTLVLVTNPEPTAHASAGAYAKEVQRLYPGKAIHVWHNRYTSRLKEGFDPRAVAENYNRFVGPADRLSPRESAALRDMAFVPEDPALDLLQGEPNPVIHVMKCMRDSLDYAHGRLLASASRRLGISRRLQDLVTSYILHHPEVSVLEEYLSRLGVFLSEVLLSLSRTGAHGVSGHPAANGAGSPAGVAAGEPYASTLQPFTPQERTALLGFLSKVKESLLRKEMLRLQDMLSTGISRLEEARGPFASRSATGPEKAMDKELARFLLALNTAAAASPQMRSHGALLLFYFSLYKLFQSRTLVGVIKSLIPRRTNRRGKTVRDRFRQIRILVESDPQYRAGYLKAVRALHVISTRQLVTIAKALRVPDLILRDRHARLDSRAYLRLLGAFLHETVYSGLSVIVGFEYRSAAAAFQNGAERLMAAMKAG